MFTSFLGAGVEFSGEGTLTLAAGECHPDSIESIGTQA